MNLTMTNVKAYLATKGPSDLIGKPFATCNCLAAYTLRWLYPNSHPEVDASNEVATLEIDGEEVEVRFDNDVRDAANTFDAFPDKWMENVTRAELEGYMPELFA